jgi:nitroreductase
MPKSYGEAGRMSQPGDVVRPLLRVRQVREFTDAALDDASLDALADAGRWSGSARNGQPWRFIVITDPARLRAMAQVGMPQTRSLATAPAAIAIVMPRGEPASDVSETYDEGRAAERILVAATLLGLGAGIAWIRSEIRQPMAEKLGLPADRYVRTIVAVGYPTEAASRPKSAPGEARLPRSETVFRERWPV